MTYTKATSWCLGGSGGLQQMRFDYCVRQAVGPTEAMQGLHAKWIETLMGPLLARPLDRQRQLARWEEPHPAHQHGKVVHPWQLFQGVSAAGKTGRR